MEGKEGGRRVVQSNFKFYRQNRVAISQNLKNIFWHLFKKQNGIHPIERLSARCSHRQRDRQTDDSSMPVADHTVYDPGMLMRPEVLLNL